MTIEKLRLQNLGINAAVLLQKETNAESFCGSAFARRARQKSAAGGSGREKSSKKDEGRKEAV